MTRIWIGLGLLFASTASVYATDGVVPEIDATSGIAAMAVIGSITALIWERRKRK
jgi:hypothetical protein